MAKIFIDGEAGTTGLQIRDKLAGVSGVELAEPAARGAQGRRRRSSKLYREVDIAILCLPDEAAKEAAQLIDAMGDEAPRVIDASTAHRVAPGWVYGFPELSPGRPRRSPTPGRSPIPAAMRPARSRCCGRSSTRASSPGRRPSSINSVSGYSGGGKSMIEAYEAAARRPSSSTGSRSSTSTCRKSNSIRPDGAADFRAVGRQFPPGHAGQRSAASGCAAGQADGRGLTRGARRSITRRPVYVKVADADARRRAARAESLNGTNDMEIYVYPNEPRRQAVVVAKFDNLGKGASGRGGAEPRVDAQRNGIAPEHRISSGSGAGRTRSVGVFQLPFHDLGRHSELIRDRHKIVAILGHRANFRDRR